MLFNIFPQIKTERFLLRQIIASDIDNIFKGLSDPAVIKYYGVNYTSIAATQVQMDWYAQLENSGTGIWWAIVSPANDSFYGAVGLYNLQMQHKKGELGFWLLPEFWGRGIVPQAVSLVCSYAFEQLALHRIEAFVETGNVNSKTVMRKLNFVHEGCMQECEIKDDQFISLDIYALLHKEQ
jgi:ribosomal-protein-alanine N-acetyltransferase